MATTDEEKKWNSGLISLMKAAEFMKRRDGFPVPDDAPLDEEEMTARGKSLSDFCCATKAAFAASHKPSAPGSKIAWTQRHATTSDIHHVYDKDIARINLAARAACPQDGDDITIPAALMTSPCSCKRRAKGQAASCATPSPQTRRGTSQLTRSGRSGEQQGQTTTAYSPRTGSSIGKQRWS